jgi:hypothetical protein
MIDSITPSKVKSSYYLTLHSKVCQPTTKQEFLLTRALVLNKKHTSESSGKLAQKTSLGFTPVKDLR